MNTEWVAPVVTGIFGVIVVIMGAILARRGEKLGAREQRAPDVQQMWAQQESDRHVRQEVEDMWWELRRAFQGYYRRVTNKTLEMSLSEEDAKAFELTPKELKAVRARPPEDVET